LIAAWRAAIVAFRKRHGLALYYPEPQALRLLGLAGLWVTLSLLLL